MLTAASPAPSLYVLGYRHAKDFLHRRTLLIFWIAINCLVFWLSYRNYKHNPRYYYIHKMLGSGLCLSRGTASMLNFACFMVFLPMCRTLTTWLRGLCTRTLPSTKWTAWRRLQVFVSRSLILPLIDNGHRLHIMCAYTILFAAVFHSLAHMVNAINFSRHYNAHYPEINVAQYSGQDPFAVILFSMPGFTGLLMVIILLILAISACERVRTRYFDVFWYSHRLFIVFVLLLLIHPLGGLLKEQVNTDKHWPPCKTSTSNHSLPSLQSSEAAIEIANLTTSSPLNATSASIEIISDVQALQKSLFAPDDTPPENVAPKNETLGEGGDGDESENGAPRRTRRQVRIASSSTIASSRSCDETPKFAPVGSETWKWLVAALVIYTLDLGVRLMRRRHAADVVGARLYEKSNVIELQLADLAHQDSRRDAKKKTKTTSSALALAEPRKPFPGHFVFLKCPQISLVEWHPFSLAAASSRWSNDTFALQIRVVGDWSNALKGKIENGVTTVTELPTTEDDAVPTEEAAPESGVENAQPDASRRMTGAPLVPPIEPLNFFVDGPFSSPTEDVFSYRVSLCIAGGIGVTPFASILSFINSEAFRPEHKLRKLFFVWVVRRRDSLQNFAHLLAQVYEQLRDSPRKDLLDVELYVSQDDDIPPRRQDASATPSSDGAQAVEDFIEERIKVGKPNWESLLDRVRQSAEVLRSSPRPPSSHLNEKTQTPKIGVFCCGPRGLKKQVKKVCRTANIEQGSSFVFKRENFGA